MSECEGCDKQNETKTTNSSSGQHCLCNCGNIKSECNKCNVKEHTNIKCPSSFCDDRIMGLPKTARMWIAGKIGKCLYTFMNGNGFVVSDEKGQYITNQPIVEIPYLKEYETDNSGAIIRDSNGNPIEKPTPDFNSFVITDKNGRHYRIKGSSQKDQIIFWDKDRHRYVEVPENFLDIINGLDPELKNFDEVKNSVCNYNVVLKCETIQELVDGRCVDVTRAKFAYHKDPIFPYGAIIELPIPPNKVPQGWTLLDGKTLNTSDYPDLFSVIGYMYGGSGETFKLPDRRGYFPRGLDRGRGIDKDGISRGLGEVQESALWCHEHTANSEFSGSPGNITTDITEVDGTGAGQTVLTPEGLGDSNFVIGVTDTSPNTVTTNVTSASACEGGNLNISEHESRPPNWGTDYYMYIGCKRCVGGEQSSPNNCGC